MLAPLVLYFIISDHRFLAFMSIFLAGVTDWLDGYLARALNAKTDFGQMFDPLADKIFILFLFIALIFQSYIPWPLGAFFLLRDLLILLCGAWAKKRNMLLDMTPLYISKVNTFFQFILGGTVLIPLFFDLFQSEFLLLAKLFMFISFITTLISGAAYAKRFFKAY